MVMHNKDVVARDVASHLPAPCPRAELAVSANSQSHLLDFLREFNPTSPSEYVLVRELARRATQLERLDQLQIAVEQQSVLALGPVTQQHSLDVASLDPMRAILAGSSFGDSLVRHSVGASRAFSRALVLLHEVRAERRDLSSDSLIARDDRFANEIACCGYLYRRVQDGAVPCSGCDQRRGGSWLAARKCWECANCKNQNGLRSGTVMAGSHVSLVQWFHAIKIVLFRPLTASAAIAATIGINRETTVRLMIKKIRAAISDENASPLLAGLDTVYLPFY